MRYAAEWRKKSALLATEAAKDWIAEEGYDPEYGARPLRRVIQMEIEDRMSDEVLAGKIVDGSTVLVDYVDGEVILTVEEPEEKELEVEPVA